MPTKNVLQKINSFRKLFSQETFFGILEQIFMERATLDYVSNVIQKRLYNEGRDSFGRKLRTDRAGSNGVYADYTVKIKKRQTDRPVKRFSSWDSRTDNVTLNDYNAFYSSWQMITGKSEAWLIGDFLKDNANTGRFSHIYENFESMFTDKFQFEEVILDLTEQEKALFFRNFIIPKCFAILDEKLKT